MTILSPIDMFKSNLSKLKKVKYGDFVSSNQYNTMFSLIRLLNSLCKCEKADEYAKKLPFFVTRFDIVQPEHHNYMVDAIKAFRDCISSFKDTKELDDIISKMRYVSKGDDILSSDKNTIIDALNWIAANAPYVPYPPVTYGTGGYANRSNSFNILDLVSIPKAYWWYIGSNDPVITIINDTPPPNNENSWVICDNLLCNNVYPYEFGETPFDLVSSATDDEVMINTIMPSDTLKLQSFTSPHYMLFPMWYSPRIPFVNKYAYPYTVIYEFLLKNVGGVKYMPSTISINLLPSFVICLNGNTDNVSGLNDLIGSETGIFEYNTEDTNYLANLAQISELAESMDSNNIAAGLITKNVISSNPESAKVDFGVLLCDIKENSVRYVQLDSYDDGMIAFTYAGMNVFYDINKSLFAYVFKCDLSVSSVTSTTFDITNPYGRIFVIDQFGGVHDTWDTLGNKPPMDDFSRLAGYNVILGTLSCMLSDYSNFVFWAYDQASNESYLFILKYENGEILNFAMSKQTLLINLLNTNVYVTSISPDGSTSETQYVPFSFINDVLRWYLTEFAANTTVNVEPLGVDSSTILTMEDFGIYFNFSVHRVYSIKYEGRDYVVLDCVIPLPSTGANETPILTLVPMILFLEVDEISPGEYAVGIAYAHIIIDMDVNQTALAEIIAWSLNGSTKEYMPVYSSSVSPFEFVLVTMKHDNSVDQDQIRSYHIKIDPSTNLLEFCERKTIISKEVFSSFSPTGSYYRIAFNDPAVFSECQSTLQSLPITNTFTLYYNYGIPRIQTFSDGISEYLVPAYVSLYHTLVPYKSEVASYLISGSPVACEIVRVYITWNSVTGEQYYTTYQNFQAVFPGVATVFAPL